MTLDGRYLHCAAGCGPYCWRLALEPLPGGFARQVKKAAEKLATLRTLLPPCACGGSEVTAEQLGALFDLMDSPPRRRPGLGSCFADRQRLRHTVVAGKTYTWTGTYDVKTKTISAYGRRYATMDSFAAAHWKCLPQKPSCPVKGWNECEYETGGGWRPVSELR
jgi:hypothetical protein